MQKLYTHLKENPICYVAKEVYHIEGLDFSKDGVYAITNDTPDARKLKGQFIDKIILIKSEDPLDTLALLEHTESREMLKGKSILVFKNTPRIERFCSENNLTLLNPSATLAKEVEEKVSQVAWLKKDASLLPPHQVTTAEEVLWAGKPFVMQFNSGHTGEGTLFITSEKDLSSVKTQFPKREVRVTDFIEGDVYTANPVVFGDDVIPGNISFQITGIAPFTDLRFASVGNDWKYAADTLTKDDIDAIHTLIQTVGKRLQKDGWKGLFSVDIIREKSSGVFYLIEVNARQGASVGFESRLQKTHTVFECHLSALLNLPTCTPKPITHGAHIFSRVTKENASMYPNYSHNSTVGHITKEDYIMESSETVRADLYTTGIVKTLPPKTKEMADAFLSFHFGNVCVPVPYLNNRRAQIRGGLNAHIGKGSVTDIETELMLLTQKAHVDSAQLTKEDITHLLVDNNIGIDCSGFVFHVLNTLSLEIHKKPLKKFLSFPFATGILRKIRAQIAPEKYTNVRTLADNANSTPIALTNIKPGDIITMLSDDPVHDHVLLCHSVAYTKNMVPHTITYIHSVPWKTDGNYGHGVRTGTISIADETLPLEAHTWTEKGVSGEQNETLGRIKAAHSEIRRLNAFLK